MKLITRETDYAIRALISIYNKKEDIVSVNSLVKGLDMPKPFLRKLLQILNKAGILKSCKGKGGGFAIKKDPKEIYLLDLMEIFQGDFNINECTFKKKRCKNIPSCILRKKIEKIDDYVHEKLKSVTLFDLIGGNE